jgi:hypothetical protein
MKQHLQGYHFNSEQEVFARTKDALHAIQW